jgi:hypothetical protein
VTFLTDRREKGRRLERCGGQIAQPRQATHEDSPHESTRGEDLRVAELVAHRAAVASRLDEADRAHRTEMLGGGGLAHPELPGELVDLAWAFAQEVEDPKAMGAGERAEHGCLELIDVVRRASHSLLLGRVAGIGLV